MPQLHVQNFKPEIYYTFGKNTIVATRILKIFEERLNFYFEANDITSAEKKRAILMNVCGPSANFVEGKGTFESCTVRNRFSITISQAFPTPE
ncbi:Esterase [Trichinella spiralis]|uniref:Esterase n=1 Tax=Trichinella spiralis TaxID=6334 RepID=A0ABR3K9S0_TRISP